jgi:hypothetical protein
MQKPQLVLLAHGLNNKVKSSTDHVAGGGGGRWGRVQFFLLLNYVVRSSRNDGKRFSFVCEQVSGVGRWVAKLVARLLASAAFWVRIKTSLKNTIWAT